jgi:hypothetical protein
MNDALKIYLSVCLFALVIKLFVSVWYKIKGDPHGLTHEKEHDLGHYIKIFLVFLLGLLLLYLSMSDPTENNLL